MAPRTASVGAWICIPVVFAVTAKAAYLFANSGMIDYYPHPAFWIVAIVLFLGAGVLVLLQRPRRRPWLATLWYVVAMTSILLAIQLLVSCSSYDCF